MLTYCTAKCKHTRFLICSFVKCDRIDITDTQQHSWLLFNSCHILDWVENYRVNL